MLQICQALALVEADLTRLANALARQAKEQRLTPVIGRSNLQQAIPVTFGHKMAGILSAVQRHQERLQQLKARLLVGEFAAAAGTLASLETVAMETQAALCAELGLQQPDIVWHTIRQNIAECGTFLGLLGGTLGKLSMDVEPMMQTGSGGGVRALPPRPRQQQHHAAEAQSDFQLLHPRRHQRRAPAQRGADGRHGGRP